MSSQHGEVVPFGKYKGQPVESLTADPEYVEWLLSQPWFATRWPNVYNVVIAYGGDLQDSPEHNQMQAKFLEENWCLALADHLGLRAGRDLDAARAVAAEDPNLERFSQHVEMVEQDIAVETAFEVNGWDVVFEIQPAYVERRMTSLPGCSCRCDHSECDPAAPCHGGEKGWRCEHRNCEYRQVDGKFRTDSYYHCSSACPWRDASEWLSGKYPRYCPSVSTAVVYVELKPEVGDDYPAVLRQVKGYEGSYGYRRVVVARRHAFKHVTWDQVVRIFAASKITLLTEQEIGK